MIICRQVLAREFYLLTAFVGAYRFLWCVEGCGGRLGRGFGGDRFPVRLLCIILVGLCGPGGVPNLNVRRGHGGGSGIYECEDKERRL